MKFVKKIIILFFGIFSFYAIAADNLCDVLNLPNCASVHKMGRRASAQSLPSAGTASSFNPANVSHDRGLGLETFYQPSNTPTFSIVTGTGKMGAGLVSSKIENSFFGNRVPEIEEDFLKRHRDDKQHTSNKLSLAIGAAAVKQKLIGVDLGILFKYNQDIKHFNVGPGISMRLGPFSLGASVIKDDVYLKASSSARNPRLGLNYREEWGQDEYKESFTVQSVFGGLKFKNFFFDMGQFTSQYKFYNTDELSIVRLYSASFIFRKFLFNVAHRIEDTPAQKFEKNKLLDKRKQHSTYGGLQYSLNKFMVFGLHYNYYLMNEGSASLTVFF